MLAVWVLLASGVLSSASALIAEEQTDPPLLANRLQVVIELDEVRRFVGQLPVHRWWHHPDMHRIRQATQGLLDKAQQRYGAFPPFVQGLAQSDRFQLQWDLKLPLHIGPKAGVDAWRFWFDSPMSSGEKAISGQWMGHPVKAHGNAESAWWLAGEDLAKLGDLSPVAKGPTIGLDFRFDADRDQLPRFGEMLASLFPHAELLQEIAPKLCFTSLHVELTGENNDLHGSTRFNGVKAELPDAPSYDVTLRRLDSQASLALPLDWGLSLWAILECVQRQSDDGLSFLTDYPVNRLLQAPWPELFSPWLYGEFWWPEDGFGSPDVVWVMACHAAQDGPLGEQDLHIYFGDMSRLDVADFHAWQLLDLPFVLTHERNFIAISTSIEAYRRYRSAQPHERQPAARPAVLDLRIPAQRLRRILAKWLWDDRLKISLSPHIQPLLSRLLYQLPSEAFVAGDEWFYYLSPEILQQFAVFEASDRGLKHLLRESVAVYRPGPWARISQPALAIRTEQGWFVQRGWEPLRGPISSREELDQFTIDMLLVNKRPAHELASFQFHQPLEIDATFLPSLELLLRPNETVYGLQIVSDQQSLRCEERGMPLVATSASLWALFMQSYQRNYLKINQRWAKEQLESEYLNQHDELYGAFEAMAAALRAYRQQHAAQPATLSQLIVGGHVQALSLAPFFAEAAQFQQDPELLDAVVVQFVDELGRVSWSFSLDEQWEGWVNGFGLYGVRPRVAMSVPGSLRR